MTTLVGHFALVVPGGWISGFVPGQTHFDLLQQQTFQSLNGDGGGTWSPSAPLIVGGSGMQIPSGAAWHALSGGSFTVDSGGTLQQNGALNIGATGTVVSNAASTFTNHGSLVSDGTLQVFGGNFAISSGVTATCASPITFFGGGQVVIPGASLVINDHAYPAFSAPLVADRMQHNVAGLVSGFTRVPLDAFSMTNVSTDVLEISLTEVHDGATLTSISAAIVGATHAGSVGSVATLDVKRVNIVSGSAQSLFSTGPQSLDSQMNSGGARTVVSYATDQNNVIDRSAYHYVAIVKPESGTNSVAGCLWYPSRLRHSISNLKFR